MKLSNFYYRSGIVAASLVFLGMAVASFPRQVQAGTEKKLLVSLEFPPGPNRQPPRSTLGAGVRGRTCIAAEGKKPLTALMSNRNNQTRTIAQKPTFFIYVPENNVETAEFVLRDDLGKVIVVEEIPIANKSGIFKFSLPESISLEVEKKYQWEFSLNCGNLPRNGNEEISGEIQRVELSPTAKEELAKAIEPMQQAQVYASNEIWQETLTLVALERCNNQEEWQELLSSVGLGDFTQEPILPPTH